MDSTFNLDCDVYEEVIGGALSIPREMHPEYTFLSSDGEWYINGSLIWFPSYTYNMQLAWQVVERIQKRFPDIHVELLQLKSGNWQCNFYDKGNYANVLGGKLRTNPAVAICEAALEVVRRERAR